MAEPARLSPTMRSRKLQALDFIKIYVARWGQSPTQQEIACHLGVSKDRVKDLVRQLERDGEIERTGEPRRNIRLRGGAEALSHADMLLRLVAAGYQVLDGEMLVTPDGIGQMTQPALHGTPPKRALPRPADLDYDPQLG